MLSVDWLLTQQNKMLDEALQELKLSPRTERGAIFTGDAQKGEAWVYIIASDAEASKARLEDSALYLPVKDLKGFEDKLFKHCKTVFDQDDGAVVKIDGQLLPIKTIVSTLLKLARQWGATSAVISRRKPGFTISCLNDSVIIQFYQPFTKLPTV